MCIRNRWSVPNFTGRLPRGECADIQTNSTRVVAALLMDSKEGPCILTTHILLFLPLNQISNFSARHAWKKYPLRSWMLIYICIYDGGISTNKYSCQSQIWNNSIRQYFQLRPCSYVHVIPCYKYKTRTRSQSF